MPHQVYRCSQEWTWRTWAILIVSTPFWGFLLIAPLGLVMVYSDSMPEEGSPVLQVAWVVACIIAFAFLLWYGRRDARHYNWELQENTIQGGHPEEIIRFEEIEKIHLGLPLPQGLSALGLSRLTAAGPTIEATRNSALFCVLQQERYIVFLLTNVPFCDMKGGAELIEALLARNSAKIADYASLNTNERKAIQSFRRNWNRILNLPAAASPA